MHSVAVSWTTRIYAIVLGLIAAALLFGGGWLASLGGSPYYLMAGMALALSAVLIWRQRREGMWLYIGIVCATIAWAIWEPGFSGWALMPRLAAWLIVSAWMLTPWFRRSLRPAHSRFEMIARWSGWGGLALCLLISVAVGAMLHPLRDEMPDPRFQKGVTPFPADRQLARRLPASGEWPHYGNVQGGTRFGTADQITPANVGGLTLAWKTSISRDPAGRHTGLEVTPLMIGDTLYACTGANEIVALDAETGKIRWLAATAGSRGRTCRGVAYYKAPDVVGPCAERILAATGDASLIAFDSRTGRRCAGFGANGVVNLLEGLNHAPAAYYYVTSAPAVIRGKVVLGGLVADGQYWGEPSGVIRAFDAITGKLAWAWDMGRPDRTGAPGRGETYTPATPNSWAPISADERLGMVYVPTGNATPDAYGVQRRPFDERYASSVIALDAETGRPRWSFQTVHHDLWDYDVPSQPSLLELPGPGGVTIPALLQLTKRGELFLLDRRTGRPIRQVEERPVPQAGKVPEESLSPTQPFSVDLPSMGHVRMRESDMWGITPLDQIYCRIKFRQARFDGTMTPPGLTPWIASPGYVGGSSWGSGSIDADRGIAIMNTTKLAYYARLITRAQANAANIKPIGPNAPLTEIAGSQAQHGTPYALTFSAFMSPLGVPCETPPFGYLSAVDLVTGKLIWSRPLGSARDSGPMGLKLGLPLPLGTPGMGGSITTRGGLVFVGATQDRTFRAFDERTGKQLWQADLPRGAFATPMTYVSPRSGRQFVVVAAGGMSIIGTADDAQLFAYSLPRSREARR